MEQRHGSIIKRCCRVEEQHHLDRESSHVTSEFCTEGTTKLIYSVVFSEAGITSVILGPLGDAFGGRPSFKYFNIAYLA